MKWTIQLKTRISAKQPTIENPYFCKATRHYSYPSYLQGAEEGPRGFVSDFVSFFPKDQSQCNIMHRKQTEENKTIVCSNIFTWVEASFLLGSWAPFSIKSTINMARVQLYMERQVKLIHSEQCVLLLLRRIDSLFMLSGNHTVKWNIICRSISAGLLYSKS